ncbi:MAG: MarR family transcriptional regulator [Candidatus Saccharimonadales bacterium]
MNISSTLSFRLHNLVYALDAVADRIITQNSPINFPQFLVLICIHQNPEATQKFVAQWLRITEATVSYTVNKLVKAGYLEVGRSAIDNRKNVLKLTPEGGILVGRLYGQLEQAIKPLFATMPARRLARLDRDIDALLNVLNNNAG